MELSIKCTLIKVFFLYLEANQERYTFLLLIYNETVYLVKKLLGVTFPIIVEVVREFRNLPLLVHKG